VIHAHTRSADETRALAAVVAELARPGDVILLAGDLGAGKTAFAQGFGAGLGVTEAITSPTFTLLNQYEGRLGLHHLDVYRLEQLAEVLDIGLPELLDEGGVTLIEWGDAITPALPADYLEVRFRFTTRHRPVTDAGPDGDPGDVTDDDRDLELLVVGPRWQARQRALATALHRFTTHAPDGGAVHGSDTGAGSERSGGAPC
jgi:tRNA threonylcarbamoyladenosine biosynthesis protein TsaE